MKTNKTKRGEHWTPSAQTRFTPVPFKLLPVARWTSSKIEAGCEEYVSPASGCGEYSGVPFDPWRKGDLVVVCIVHRAHSLPGQVKMADSETWQVMYRGTTPGQKRCRFTFDPSGDLSSGFVDFDPYRVRLCRVTYRCRQAAAKLVGQQYETREQLEAALDAPVQQRAVAA